MATVFTSTQPTTTVNPRTPAFCIAWTMSTAFVFEIAVATADAAALDFALILNSISSVSCNLLMIRLVPILVILTSVETSFAAAANPEMIDDCFCLSATKPLRYQLPAK